jgi:hypothetical protein
MCCVEYFSDAQYVIVNQCFLYCGLQCWVSYIFCVYGYIVSWRYHHFVVGFFMHSDSHVIGFCCCSLRCVF